MIKEPASREAKQLFLLIHASKISDWRRLACLWVSRLWIIRAKC